ncbi:MAG: peptidoglycan bridge formation glycyltransferase FemA/FemB family protein [Spirochaetales bacterium]|nr:peptidoglycan bridge formation glycyltransferase FemA/FemB family protein [Spirochaetales bacterium]
MNIRVEQTAIRSLDGQDELFQTGFWAVFKQQFGWKPYPFRLSFNGINSSLLVLTRNLGLGFHLGYIPMGPLLPEPESGKEDMLIALSGAVSPLLPANTCFLRYDLPWSKEGKGNLPVPLFIKNRLVKASADIQPPYTIIVDLRQTEEALLAGMKHKTRYNIRLAEKKGVNIVETGIERLPEWYSLYRETGIRDRIALHSEHYYESLFRLADDYGKGAPAIKLLLAEIEGEAVAGIVIVIKGTTALYMYGASSNRYRNYMPNHLLQWRGMQISKQAGCTSYDFFGIPPADEPDHPLHGLYRFKTGFGGKFVNRYGAHDLIIRSFLYRIYRIAEKTRTFYYKKLKKWTGNTG